MMPFAALLTYGGLLGLCLAMDKHYQQVFGGSLATTSRIALRAAGWLLLAGSLLLSVTGANWSFGLLAWLGWLLAAGLCVVLSLATMPRAALFSITILLVVIVALT
jgi:hypothetical protein